MLNVKSLVKAVANQNNGRLLSARRRLLVGALVGVTLIVLVALVVAVVLPGRVEQLVSANAQPTMAPEASDTLTPGSGAPLATFVVILPGAIPATPTVALLARPSASPTAIPSPARPAATLIPPSQGRAMGTLVVANADPDGVSIRKEPGAGERIRVWRDGTAMTFLGEEGQAAERVWKKVRDPEGNEGWVAAEFLVEVDARSAAETTIPTVPAPSPTVGPLGPGAVTAPPTTESVGLPTSTSRVAPDGGPTPESVELPTPTPTAPAARATLVPTRPPTAVRGRAPLPSPTSVPFRPLAPLPDYVPLPTVEPPTARTPGPN